MNVSSDEALDISRLSDDERALPRDAVGRYHKYGVSFLDLQPSDLELLRRWRNHPDIQQFMVFRDAITPEMQLRWYLSIDGDREAYSIVLFRGRRVGLTQLRNIDPVAGSAEGGLIIFRGEDQNGLLTYRAALAGMDWDFLERGLSSLWVTVLKTNSRARRLVRSLGYVLHDPDPAGDILRGVVTAAAYFRAAAPWREVIRAETEAEREPGDPFSELGEEERALPRDERGWYGKYGVTFVDLFPSDLELLGAWRTHPDIGAQLGDATTPEEQLRWYREIDPDRNAYSIIEYRGERIGLAHLAIAPDAQSGEGNAMMFRAEHESIAVRCRVLLAGLDWEFLGRGLRCLSISGPRPTALMWRLLTSLGFVFSEPPSAPSMHGEVKAADYFPAARKWRQAAAGSDEDLEAAAAKLLGDGSPR
jgi:RimJ/RimL family protein N-acetyltransferase